MADGIDEKALVSPWISVKDRLPEINHKVLFLWIYGSGYKNVSMGYLCDEGGDIYLPYHSFQLHNETDTVTHWMVLPKFPEILIDCKDHGLVTRCDK
jgi:hypothetical protein